MGGGKGGSGVLVRSHHRPDLDPPTPDPVASCGCRCPGRLRLPASSVQGHPRILLGQVVRTSFPSPGTDSVSGQTGGLL